MVWLHLLFILVLVSLYSVPLVVLCVTLVLSASSLLRIADNLSGSIDQQLEDGDTALHLTCLYGHLPCVQVGHIAHLSIGIVI